ncbi:hemicentin-2-like [Culicoides brevitarsis]|uniref:hemicentin-2-like n=1 Tax=Culicoides brevitarsis TaxID=469753 RepID=UPI00307C31A8
MKLLPQKVIHAPIKVGSRRRISLVHCLWILLYEFCLVADARSGKIINEKHVHAVNIEAVEGRSISLPCPMSTNIRDVYMVLWFRDTAGIPLYSFDVRDKSFSKPKHWSAPEVFGPRAKYSLETQPESLIIKDIKRHDQGIYRCRIDFRTSQTQSFRYNLSVIILPEQPIVLDRWGVQLNGTKLGPKQEGDDLMITCRVVGGRPQPQVQWLINGDVIDDECEQNSGDVIENRLLWPSIARNDLNSVFTCQALNTLLVEPKETSFVLDMNLKPLTVNIMDPPNRLVADRRYEVTCISTGSRPNAIITWWKGKRQLRRTKDDILNNTTRSELSFVPTTEDDGKSITCRAENPTVNGLFMETSWKLDVVYPPLVTLRLGSTLSPDDIKEGDDVYFECHVQANPQWRKLSWLHDGVVLTHNTTARIIRSNQSLVLQKITKNSAGNYACSAINPEGETVSNQLSLRVKYAPVCSADRVILIGAAKNENIEIPCEIHADPPARTFRWKFNNSGETLDMNSDRFSINGTNSVLKYTPITDQDYGTLSCWASNEVGMQVQACVFQVVLATLPSIVSNCTLHNQTHQIVEIQCLPGYDGGLPQVFVLEMRSKKTNRIRFNFTNSEEPYFMLDTLDAINAQMTNENDSLTSIIYAMNQKGRSAGALIRELKIGESLRQEDPPDSLELSPILIGSVLTVFILSFFIFFKICIASLLKNCKEQQQQDIKITQQSLILSSTNNGSSNKEDAIKINGSTQKSRWQHSNTEINNKTKSIIDVVEDERDPDVIPSQYSTVGSTPTPDHYAPQQQPKQGHLQGHIQSPCSIDDINKLQLNSSSVYYNNVSTLPMTNSYSNSNSINNSNNLHHVQHKNLLYQTLDGQINSIATTSKDFTTLVTTNALANSSPATSLMSMSLSSTATLPSNHHHHPTLGGSVIGPSGGMSTSGHITVGGSDLDLNINAIKDRLMTTRVPESCV